MTSPPPHTKLSIMGGISYRKSRIHVLALLESVDGGSDLAQSSVGGGPVEEEAGGEFEERRLRLLPTRLATQQILLQHQQRQSQTRHRLARQRLALQCLQQLWDENQGSIKSCRI